MLGGQDQKKSAKSTKTGLIGLKTSLTGPSGSLQKIPVTRTRQGQASRSSWSNMRRKELPSNRRKGQIKLRIQSHHQSIKNNRIIVQAKVITLLSHMHLVSRLLHCIAGILVMCHWIIFIILLYIQVVLHKDRLVIIWSKRTFIAVKSVRRTQNKIQNI